MKKQFILGAMLLIAMLFYACAGPENKKEAASSEQLVGDEKEQGDMKESLIARNKARMQAEQKNIEDFVAKKQWVMEKTATGLRYKIIKKGTGPTPRMMSDVELNYTITHLDGSYIYSSDSSGVLGFTMGQSNEPGGLQEALLSIPQGSTAMLIIPSYLAYGLTGDGDKIQGGESLIYNIEVLKVSTK
jgi:FKBP-type peptidyl-prolyl cis-trans isomerase